jgi:hypothetical protein
LLAILCKSFLGSAQITTDDIAKLKTQWHATTKDSARMLIAGQLANGYRFSNVINRELSKRIEITISGT